MSNHELNAHIRQILEYYDEITHAILLPDNKAIKVNVSLGNVTINVIITNRTNTNLGNSQIGYLNDLSSELVSRYLLTGL